MHRLQRGQQCRCFFTGAKSRAGVGRTAAGRKAAVGYHGYTEKIYRQGIAGYGILCGLKKNSGDDPDITNGVLVYSQVRLSETGQIHIDGGIGVGRVIRPGLNQPVGEAAINRVPRQMIRKEVEEACEEVGYTGGIDVEISIPEGARLAKETFNPRLGIEGGLSILGTTGIVNPMSEQALIDTIEVEMKVCLAEKYRYLIIAPGNYGLDFLKEQYSIEENDVVKCSNYIGQAIDMAVEQDCKGVLLVGHIGKLIKVSGGIMNTHSRWADCRMDLFATAALRAGIAGEKAVEFLDCVTTDDALEKCSEEERTRIMAKNHDAYGGISELPGERRDTGREWSRFPMYTEFLERQKKQKN
mgnify:CR=1 FL=1